MTAPWSRNIKRRREDLGLSKAAFARSVGVSPATVSDWESGVIKNIEGQHLVRAALVLKTSAERLFLDDGLQAGEPSGGYLVRPDQESVPVHQSLEQGVDGDWHAVASAANSTGARIPFATSVPGTFAIVIAQDALRPRFKPGEYVVLEPLATPLPGQEVALQLADDRMILRIFNWQRGSLVQVSPVNEDGRPSTLTTSNIVATYRVAATIQASIDS